VPVTVNDPAEVPLAMVMRLGTVAMAGLALDRSTTVLPAAVLRLTVPVAVPPAAMISGLTVRDVSVLSERRAASSDAPPGAEKATRPVSSAATGTAAMTLRRKAIRSSGIFIFILHAGADDRMDRT
jgi:hypothetical protein